MQILFILIREFSFKYILKFMEENINTVLKQDLKTFESYLTNFWMFLQLDQESLVKSLQ